MWKNINTLIKVYHCPKLKWIYYNSREDTKNWLSVLGSARVNFRQISHEGDVSPMPRFAFYTLRIST